MRIAQLAANTERVPPDGYGGTELVVSLITEELVKRGHEVTLFAAGNSVTEARLVSVTDQPLRTDSRYNSSQAPSFDLQLLIKLEDMQNQFDIVHNHMSWFSLQVLNSLRCASVTTNHNHVKDYCAPIYLRYKDLPYVSISDAYRTENYGDQLNYAATIYNGIDVDAFAVNGENGDRNYLLFIGRLCKDKGTAEAIEVAERLNMPMKIAGKIDERDIDYFENEVKPRLAYKGAEFLGEVGPEEKAKLYKNSIALVYPILFNEPFGLVMAEAMAAGTPVLSFDRGSVREVLSDKETAVIGNSVDDLVNRFDEIKTIDRKACEKRVRDLFSVKTMVDKYEELYEKLIADKKRSR